MLKWMQQYGLTSFVEKVSTWISKYYNERQQDAEEEYKNSSRKIEIE